MRSVCCEVTWHLWAGEDDVVYLESLLCGREVISAGEGDQKKKKKKTLVTSSKAGRSCSQQIQIFTLTFRHFFFPVNWETLKIILIVAETPQG